MAKIEQEQGQSLRNFIDRFPSEILRPLLAGLLFVVFWGDETGHLQDHSFKIPGNISISYDPPYMIRLSEKRPFNQSGETMRKVIGEIDKRCQVLNQREIPRKGDRLVYLRTEKPRCFIDKSKTDDLLKRPGLVY